MYICIEYRADSRFVLSQWETALLRNDVSHWLGANLESALEYPSETRLKHKSSDISFVNNSINLNCQIVSIFYCESIDATFWTKFPKRNGNLAMSYGQMRFCVSSELCANEISRDLIDFKMSADYSHRQQSSGCNGMWSLALAPPPCKTSVTCLLKAILFFNKISFADSQLCSFYSDNEKWPYHFLNGWTRYFVVERQNQKLTTRACVEPGGVTDNTTDDCKNSNYEHKIFSLLESGMSFSKHLNLSNVLLCIFWDKCKSNNLTAEKWFKCFGWKSC